MAPLRFPSLEKTRALYDERFPNKEAGVYAERDWRRCEEAYALVQGPRVLEVGVGPGQMFYALAQTDGVQDLLGLDVAWNQKLIRPEVGRLEIMNVIDLKLEDASWDTVLCMEVLEHLDVIDFPKALHELRRVCRGTLIVTVPYKEPEPVWHHDRRGGHRQSFPEEKIERFFPRAERRLVFRGKGKWKWIMLIERFGGQDSERPAEGDSAQ